MTQWRKFTTAIGLVLMLATHTQPVAAQPAPPPDARNYSCQRIANIGSCSGCYQCNWVNGNDVLCQNTACTVGDYPTCASRAPGPICKPGSQFEVTRCGVTGVERCSYTCNAQGSGYVSVCQAAGNGGNVRHTYCDYNAGCGGGNGYLIGQPVTVAETCTQNGAQQTVTRGQCGTGGCMRRLQCPPGRKCGCPPEGCTQCTWANGVSEPLMPECGPSGNGYACKYGRLMVEVAMPCPSVARTPYPYGLVSLPNALGIVSTCAGLSAQNSVGVPEPWDQCGDTVIGYRGQLAWLCSRPDQSDATWQMDERPWNVGHVSADGSHIEAQRSGRSIRHIYETSSVDRPINGPGANGAKRVPAYQVQLTTHWALVGNFQYQVRKKIEVCRDGAGHGISPCYSKYECERDKKDSFECRAIAIRASEIISPWVDGPAIVIPDIPIIGARVPQDVVGGQSCGPIQVPILQSQSVLVK